MKFKTGDRIVIGNTACDLFMRGMVGIIKNDDEGGDDLSGRYAVEFERQFKDGHDCSKFDSFPGFTKDKQGRWLNGKDLTLLNDLVLMPECIKVIQRICTERSCNSCPYLP